ncbi:MAG: cytochrome c peroxidase [Ignavibacteriota bacterium]
MCNRNSSLSIAGLLSLGLIFTSVNAKAEDAAVAGRMPASFDRDVAAVVANLDRIEADTLRQMSQLTLDRQGQIRTLGKLLLFDKHLSVKENEACSFCHTPETGFTGPIQSLNLTTVSYPGSVRDALQPTQAPELHVCHLRPRFSTTNALQGDFVGGNFWDMRASGYRLQNPAAEQAQGPPTNPVEMGLPDSACLAYRISKAPQPEAFRDGVGIDSFHIQWPADVEKVCATPGPPPADDQYPVHLSRRTGHGPIMYTTVSDWPSRPTRPRRKSARSRRSTTPCRPEKVQLTPQEKAGYDLFRGVARCNECHRDGGPGEEPLFTDFTASNLGVPVNRGVQFYYESAAEAGGYSPNPPGQQLRGHGSGILPAEAEEPQRPIESRCRLDRPWPPSSMERSRYPRYAMSICGPRRTS